MYGAFFSRFSINLLNADFGTSVLAPSFTALNLPAESRL